jgi:hypothetical protein
MQIALPLPENRIGASPWGEWSWRKGRKTSNVQLFVPGIAARWFYAIELYAYRHKMRQEGQYREADFCSHLINVCGLKRRATLAKRGTLKPWNKREVA